MRKEIGKVKFFFAIFKIFKIKFQNKELTVVKKEKFELKSKFSFVADGRGVDYYLLYYRFIDHRWC